MKDFFILLRPHQYIKNLFICLPLFFVGQITEPGLLFHAFIAFVAFSFSASAVYILNDYKDIEEDRLHPKKKYRPLAAGSISKKNAIFLLGGFAITGISLMAVLSSQAVAFLGVYIALNIGYSFRFKHFAILDVVIIAIGFVLRLFVGSSVTGIPLSKWIVMMTFLLALFLALAKRRDDVLIFLDTGNKIGKALDGYNLRLIDGAMLVMASVVIVAYILYTTATEVIQQMHTDNVYFTALFVILGILRYIQITFVEHDSGSPTQIVLRDKFMQTTILAWLLTFAWIIYL